MTENEIDIKVNFHLNDIVKLFEESLKGNNNNILEVLGNVGNEESKIKGGLLYDIEMTEDKTKFYEGLENLKITSDIFKNIKKIVSDIQGSDVEDKDIIERTERTMITLLTLSKTMLMMFNEKFPISAELAKDLEEMKDTLQDNNLSLDDKMNRLEQAMNNTFTSSKQQTSLPAAFNIIMPQASSSRLSFTDAQLDEMEDYILQVNDFFNIILDKININKSKNIYVGGEMIDKIENMKDISDYFYDTQISLNSQITEARGRTGGEGTGTGAGATAAALQSMMLRTSNEAGNVFNEIQSQTEAMFKVFEEMKLLLTESVDKMGAAALSLAGSTAHTGEFQTEVVNILGEAGKDIKNTVKDVKKSVTDEVKRIKTVLKEDYYQGTIEDIVSQLVKMRFVKPLSESATLSTLQHALKLAETTLNTLYAQMGTAAKGISRENLIPVQDVLNQMAAVVNISRENLDKATKNDHEPHFKNLKEGGGGGTGTDQMMFEMMFEMMNMTTINTTAKDQMIESVDSGVKQLLVSVNELVLETGKINLASDTFRTNVNTIATGMTLAGQQLVGARKEIDKQIAKTNRIVNKWNETMGSTLGRIEDKLDDRN